MNPLELVSKTLYSFGEKELTFTLLDSFGKRAKTFQQYDELAKIFFELGNFSKAIEYGEQSLKLTQTKEERYINYKNLINVYNQSNYPEKSIPLIEKCKLINSKDSEILLEETFAYSALNQKEMAEKLLFNLLRKKHSEEIEMKVYHNLSGHYFKKDDIHTGLQHFLKSGEKEAYKNKKHPSYEKWNGTIVPVRSINIYNEGSGVA